MSTWRMGALIKHCLVQVHLVWCYHDFISWELFYKNFKFVLQEV
jgi:hypothetical protein